MSASLLQIRNLRASYGKIEALKGVDLDIKAGEIVALIGANGKALTMLATAMQARGHLDVREFSELLGIFSVVVGEDDDLEGMILAVWAGLLKDSVSS